MTAHNTRPVPSAASTRLLSHARALLAAAAFLAAGIPLSTPAQAAPGGVPGPPPWAGGHYHGGEREHGVDRPTDRAQPPAIDAPVDVPVNGPAVVPGPIRFGIAHANIKVGAARFASSMRKVTAGNPDFITLNEVNYRSRRDITPHGYASHRSKRSAATAETPVLWRSDTWAVVGAGHRYLTTRAVKWGVRAVNWATLRHRASGHVVSVVSAHPAPTINVTRGLLPRFVTGLAQLTNELAALGHVVVGGDLNVGYRGRAFPTDTLDSARLKTTYDTFGRPHRGTNDHGITIDYVLYREHPSLRPVSQTVKPLRHSDHHKVAAQFVLDGPPIVARQGRR